MSRASQPLSTKTLRGQLFVRSTEYSIRYTRGTTASSRTYIPEPPDPADDDDNDPTMGIRDNLEWRLCDRRRRTDGEGSHELIVRPHSAVASRV